MIEKAVIDTIFHALREFLVAEGWLPDVKAIPNYDSTEVSLVKIARETYLNQCELIRQNKGFCIEIMNFSSNLSKGDKKVPRIVIDINQFLPGELGNDVGVYYQLVQTPGQPDKYIRQRSSPLLSDLTFSVFAVGALSKHLIVMNDLIMRALPMMGYIKPLEAQDFLPYNNYFVRLVDKGVTHDNTEGIRERYFVYQIPDLSEVPEIIIPGDIALIEQITLEPYGPTTSS